MSATDTKGILMGMVFNWFDYTLFFVTLAISVTIGLYFGCCGRQDSVEEYLLGGRKMKVVPIAVSMAGSIISGVTMLGIPSDVYQFGVTYWLFVCMVFFACAVSYYVFYPVFYKLQSLSTYAYLMHRFDRRLRLISSALYTITSLCYLPIVVYIPALAVAKGTQIDVHWVTPIFCMVCIFYTTIGGLKAVVWTDVIQFVVMLVATFCLLYKGIEAVGGPTEMWTLAKESKRLDLDFDINPTKRDTVVATLIGTFFMLFHFLGIGQSYVQKYLSLPTMEDAKKALLIFTILTMMITSAAVISGLAMYARYHDCDPFSAGKIKRHDEIVPYYVMDMASSMPGLAGLFLSGLCSAALSTFSASMNSLSGAIYEDFISGSIPEDITQKRVSNILKLIVVIIGVICTGMVYVIEAIGDNILSITYVMTGITVGPLIGVFSLGILFPIATAQGAFYGSLGSMGMMTVIVVGNRVTHMRNALNYQFKPVSVAGCNNVTLVANMTVATTAGDDGVFFLFRITHYYYIFLGTILTLLIGIVISALTRKKTDPPVDPDLISPVSKWLIKRFSRSQRIQQSNDNVEYYDVNRALEQLTIDENCQM